MFYENKVTWKFGRNKKRVYRKDLRFKNDIFSRFYVKSETALWAAYAPS